MELCWLFQFSSCHHKFSTFVPFQLLNVQILYTMVLFMQSIYDRNNYNESIAKLLRNRFNCTWVVRPNTWATVHNWHPVEAITVERVTKQNFIWNIVSRPVRYIFQHSMLFGIFQCFAVLNVEGEKIEENSKILVETKTSTRHKHTKHYRFISVDK